MDNDHCCVVFNYFYFIFTLILFLFLHEQLPVGRLDSFFILY